LTDVAEEFPKVSIIVTSRNNAETIGECLKALFEQDYPREAFEVIVIDACSSDGTDQIAEKTPAKVFSLAVNAAAAYNYAMKIASNSILGFVDSDAKVEREWLKKLVPHLAEPQVAGVSGAIETWNMENPWARSIGYEIKNRYSRIGKYTGRIATMNLLMKKSVIEEAGGWDETLPSQYDTDLGFRVTAKGYRFAYEPSAKCYHFNRPTVRAYWRQQLQYGKNTLKLYFKHSKLARGDEITDFGMNIQPGLLLGVMALFLLGIVPLLRPLWYASAVLFAAMFIYYIYSAAKLSAKFKDRTAMRLVAFYFVRTVAWTCGAAITTAKYISGEGRGRKK
jgi:cellulose synthase/poly-beta-1,6-N-acetylglucosamine synthase-like glycosyltransferase